MILDDESFLSAYLDGELDSGERHRVEMALTADPSLGEQLRQLAAVRELVDSLPTPVLDKDLSSSILAQLNTRRRYPTILGFTVRPPRMRTFAEFSVAATIMIALSASLVLVLRNLPPRPDRAPHIAVKPAPPKTLTVASRPPAPAAPTKKVEGEKTPVKAASSEPLTIAKNDPPAPVVSPAAPADEAAQKDRQFVKDLVSNSESSRLFVIDVIGDQGSNEIGSLINDMPRIDPAFGRISVRKGLAFDPRRPSEATVFAFLADEKELTAFRERLQKQFPDFEEESGTDRTLLAQLGEIPQVTVLPGTRTADLLAHSRENSVRVNALRAETKPRSQPKPVISEEFENMHVVEVAESPNGEEGPTPEQMRSGPHPSNLTTKAQKGSDGAGHKPSASSVAGNPPLRPASPAHRRSTLVLVWVANSTDKH